MKEMKTRRIIISSLIALFALIVTFWACNKDNGTDTQSGITTANISEIQQSESQDAIADKIETDIDNNLDALEANNYTVSSLKSAPESCVDIQIDSTGTNVFPRTVTLTYNCIDTVNGERIAQTGQVKIIVNRIKENVGTGYYSRSMTFTNFKFETDSSSVNVNGTRNLVRTQVKSNLSGDKKNYRTLITDSISSNLSFAITYKRSAPAVDTTITFTRIVSRERNAALHSKRVGLLRWASDIRNDSITFTGKVEGVNAQGVPYMRNYTSPVKCVFCPYWPYNLVITSGEIEVSSNNVVIGTISYSANGCATEVTLNKDGKSKTIKRRFALRFNKWW